jgi:hypothetical protein
MTSSRFGIASVREAVRKRVAETSLRDTADEIGMSFSGLRSFVRGATPHAATRAKLVSWYSGGRSSGAAGKADVAAAISLLAGYVSSAATASVKRRRLEEIVRQIGASVDK